MYHQKKKNWLKYKKYISSHINIDYRINSERDIDQSISELDEIIAKTVFLETPNQTNWSQKITIEIEKLVTEKRRARREWQANSSPFS